MEIDLWQDRGVPVNQDSPRSCPSPTSRRSLTTKRGEIEAKSFVIKDLTRKSFRFKDQSQNFLLTL